MIAQIPPDVLSAIPSKWLVYINTTVLVAAMVGRAYQSIRNGGGLVSIWRGLLYGTNIPTKTANAPTNGQGADRAQ